MSNRLEAPDAALPSAKHAVRFWVSTSASTYLALAVVVVVEFLLAPWTSHAYDTGSFLSHADRVYIFGMNPAAFWSFGVVFLVALLSSQAPFWIFPGLRTYAATRIFALKVPLLLADASAALSISSLTPLSRMRMITALRYVLDPAVVFFTLFHGMFDGLANAFVAGALVAVIRRKPVMGGILLGLGTGTKYYPILLLPVLAAAMYRRNGLRICVRFVGAACAVAGLTTAPVLMLRKAAVLGSVAENTYGAASAAPHAVIFSLWHVFDLIGIHAAMPWLVKGELAVAVAVPIIVGAALSVRRDNITDAVLAKAVTICALAVVLLNPGASPQFITWTVAPLVATVALTSDEVLSLLGVALSAVIVALQVGAEGWAGYWLNALGDDPARTVFPGSVPIPPTYIAFLCVAAALVAWLARGPRRRLQFARLPLGTVAATLFALYVYSDIGIGVASRTRPLQGPFYDETFLNTFVVEGHHATEGSHGCKVTYSLGDLDFFSAPKWSRYVSASIEYSRGDDRHLALTVPHRLEEPVHDDLTTLAGRPVLADRMIDVSKVLRPFAADASITYRSCAGVEAARPVLVYRLNVEAATKARAHP